VSGSEKQAKGLMGPARGSGAEVNRFVKLFSTVWGNPFVIEPCTTLHHIAHGHANKYGHAAGPHARTRNRACERHTWLRSNVFSLDLRCALLSWALPSFALISSALLSFALLSPTSLSFVLL
jgi:hypothetical protein